MDEKRILRPILPTVFEKTILIDEIENYDVVENMVFKNIKIIRALYGVEFRHCKFIDVDFSTSNSENIHFIHCYFEHSDLSNLDLSATTLHTIEMKDCKLVGTDVSKSSIRDITLNHCMARYMNFNFATMENSNIENSNLQEVSMNNVILKKVYLEDTDFKGSEFLHTKLKQIDLSTCNMKEIKISVDCLIGAIISEEQAISMISLFGIVIK